MRQRTAGLIAAIAFGIAIASFGPTFGAVGNESSTHPKPKPGSTWTMIDDRSAAAMSIYVAAPGGGSHYYYLAAWKETVALEDGSVPQNGGGYGVILTDRYTSSNNVTTTREWRSDANSTRSFTINGATGYAHLAATLDGRSGMCAVNAAWDAGEPNPDSSYSSPDVKEDLWTANGNAAGTCFDPAVGSTLQASAINNNGGYAKVWERIDRSESSNFPAPPSPLPGQIVRLAGNGNGPQSSRSTPASQAFLFEPQEPQVAPDGTIYFLEPRSRVSVLKNGMVSPLKGCSTGCDPYAIAIDRKGNLFVSDSRGLERFNTRGQRTTLAGKFDAGGPMIVSADGSIYASTVNGLIRFKNGVQTQLGQTWCGEPLTGPVSKVTFCDVQGMTAGSDGSVYVANEGVIRKITPQGTVEIVYSSDRRSFTNCLLMLPCDPSFGALAIGPDGYLYFSDSALQAIVRLDHGQTIPVAGGGSCQCDGVPALTVTLGPYSVDFAFDRRGRIVIADGEYRLHLADITLPPALSL
ncbi:MAG: NHL repeat-containing protein [Actinomycetota bacterium]